MCVSGHQTWIRCISPWNPVNAWRWLVLVNLLSNALKSSRNRDHPHIEVWAEQGPLEWAIFVHDNGVGFDPLYQDRLFQMFQRLHGEDEFGGVGLTSVRRAITKHGGTVFAMGVPSEGATFGFTLPRPVSAVPEAEDDDA
ncbi:sensor histidine kinase [Deinococcus sp. UYEF24]